MRAHESTKKFTKLKKGIGPFLDENKEIVTDNFEMAEMLRMQHKKSFSKPLERAQIHINYLDVLDAIDSLSPNAGHGPDSFHAILLKKRKIFVLSCIDRHIRS